MGGKLALANVSLEVPPGVVFALLGENGAGKTTAIRIMLGLAEPNAGQAEVLGSTADKQGLEIRQRVGYVPERPTLYEWMTVEEIGWFTAGFYGAGFLPEYAGLVGQIRPAAAKEAQNALEGDAGQGGAVVGWPTSRNCWSSTSRPPGWTPWSAASSWRAWWIGRRTGQTVFLVEPSDRRGGAGGRHRGHPRRGSYPGRETGNLKEQVREVTLTLTGNEEPPRALGGEVLRECRRCGNGRGSSETWPRTCWRDCVGVPPSRPWRFQHPASRKFSSAICGVNRRRKKIGQARGFAVNALIFTRLLWKEYRLQRGFWLEHRGPGVSPHAFGVGRCVAR